MNLNTIKVGDKMVFHNEFNRHEWGMTPNEFRALEAHRGQMVTVTGIDIEDSGQPDYVTIKFSDGYKLESVSVEQLTTD